MGGEMFGIQSEGKGKQETEKVKDQIIRYEQKTTFQLGNGTHSFPFSCSRAADFRP